MKPKKSMTFFEAIKGLKDGKKFRRKSWPDFYSDYIDCVDCDIRSFSGNCYCIAALSMPDFEADDWVEVK